MKVLLFSNDLMPFGELPTSGGGLRCWQLKCGLEARGIEVVSSMPGFTYLTEKYFDKIPAEQREHLWQWGTQDQILKRVKPDAVLFASNWDHFNLGSKPDVPLIVDLHGSRLIETSMWNTPIDTDRKVSVLGKADCLLTAGRRQRLYFYGWLVQAGRVPEDQHFIRYIPISLSPEQPQRLASTDSPHFVSGGGWFPWQNQSNAIFSICDQISRRQRGLIQIFGTPHETQNLSPEEMVIRDIYRRVKDLAAASPRIRAEGYIGRDALIEIYRRADVAVELMRYNIERELAFTTRTIEYLWCGLPVIYNDYSEISDHIRDYDAGWALNPDDQSAVDGALDEIFSRPDIVRKKSENAQRLVRDRFSWEKTIEPLVDFLNNPQRARSAVPALGAVTGKPSYLVPRGSVVDVPLSGGDRLTQELIVPSDGITAIHIPFEPAKAASNGTVQISVSRSGCDKTSGQNGSGSKICCGKKLVRDLRIKPAERSENLDLEGKRIVIRLSPFSMPAGGSIVRIAVSAEGPDGEPVITLKGMESSKYPLVRLESSSRTNGGLRGINFRGEAAPVEALSVSFVQGVSKYQRIKTLATRAIRMMRHGEWSRIYRATSRRLPGIINRVRERVLHQ